nr:hypothetical protein [uncultured Oscillibacter sp.]
MDGKKDRIQSLTLLLCVVLLGLNFWQLRQISDLRNQLGSVESNLQMETRRLDERVQAVQRTGMEADKLVQDWDIISAEPDRASRSLRVEASVSLKEWREDTAAELLWTGDGGTVGEGSAPLSGGGKGTFTGVLEIPLDRGRLEFALDILIGDGGSQRRENLGGVYDTGELLPVQCTYQGGRTQAEYLKGAFTVYECGAELYTKNYAARTLETEGQVFRLRRNGEIAAEQAAEPGDRLDEYSCGKLSAAAEPGDRMALTFFCRDENGLGYEFLLHDWVAVAERDVAPVNSEWEDWPRLTWD